MRKISVPAESRLARRAAAAFFTDAFEAPLLSSARTAAEIAEIALRSTPALVEALIGLRNALAAPAGIRPVPPLGRVAPPAPGGRRPGQPFGMFTVASIDEDELVLDARDRHLDVWISFLRRTEREPATYVVSSVVEVHNRLGAVYMAPVRLIHPLIVVGMMAYTAI